MGIYLKMSQGMKKLKVVILKKAFLKRMIGSWM